ncbi:MAG: AbrB/MazE/SpoVT family DNA-binding domain-containing protein [Euryarchaeota archaeon]|nr:AbrB/MazE/SpoVT family DNA-binding domain-containing protein [Euryarchaeota archaeon]
MERRKVQRTGGSTYIVSLPKKWVDGHNIQQGDPVDVHYDPGGSVTIHPIGTKGSPARSLRLVIDTKKPTEHLVRRIISAYLAGYESIQVHAPERIPMAHKQEIRRLGQTLIGIEIVEETQSSITLQDLLDPVDFDITRGLDRMHQLARAMVGDALTALTEKDQDLADDVPQRDPEVDRLDWMIVKQFHLVSRSGPLARALGLGPSEALHHLLVSHAIERIADHASRLAELATQAPTLEIQASTRDAIRAQGHRLLELLQDSFRAFQDADYNKANDTITELQVAGQEAHALLAKGKGLPAKTQVNLALLVKSLERVRSYSIDIAEAAIDHHLMREMAGATS